MPRDFSIESVGESVGGVLDGLKSRLGFSHDEERYAPDQYDDDYGEYDDFGEYDDYAPDSNAGGFRPAQAGSGTSRTSRFGRADSSPALVSFDDVKYSTPLPDSRPEPRPQVARTTGSYSSTTNVGGHTVIDATVPVPSSPAYKAAVRDGAVRPDSSASSVGTGAATGAFDPYEAYSSPTPSSYSTARKLTVIKPVVYGDVERVARAVKSGDVVVLAMRNTPDDLSKRILDFSFGVASALDANVECPGDKVFAIARGNALTEDEKRRLRTQSVL